MDHTMLLKRAQTTADRAEKSRQSLSSMSLTIQYQYIVAAIIGLFILRRLILYVSSKINNSTRAPAAEKAIEKISEKESTEESTVSSPKPRSRIVRICIVTDRWFQQRPPPYLFSESWVDLCLFLIVITSNIAVCLIVAVTPLSPQTAASNIARAVTRRTGRIAVANFPILFATFGRRNLISILTGIKYQSIRRYHKLIGRIVAIQVLIHVLGQTGYYLVSLGVAALAEEYSEAYFKYGIAGTVGVALSFFFSLRFFRSRQYEWFLILHIIGAALFLSGTFYHEMITVKWVYTALALWSFERLFRLFTHFITISSSSSFTSFSPRSLNPFILSSLSLHNGGILLTVPMKRGVRWNAGDHVYLSFWTRSSWVMGKRVGESHPFSIMNLPSSSSCYSSTKMEGEDEKNEMRFLLRVKKGVTKDLAQWIIDGKGGNHQIRVGVEGPYGHSMEKDLSRDQFETVLLCAGGSGITHVISVVEELYRRNQEIDLKLVWAVHQFEQIEWIRTSLDTILAIISPHTTLTIDIYITRSSHPSLTIQKEDTLNNDPKILIEKQAVSESSPFSTHHLVQYHFTRPDFDKVVRNTIEDTNGRTLIIACGPDSLINVVRLTSEAMKSFEPELRIASFVF